MNILHSYLIEARILISFKAFSFSFSDKFPILTYLTCKLDIWYLFESIILPIRDSNDLKDLTVGTIA
jgi:hypothetical protein